MKMGIETEAVGVQRAYDVLRTGTEVVHQEQESSRALGQGKVEVGTKKLHRCRGKFGDAIDCPSVHGPERFTGGKASLPLRWVLSAISEADSITHFLGGKLLRTRSGPLSRDSVSFQRSFCLSVCGTLYTFGGPMHWTGALSRWTFKNAYSLGLRGWKKRGVRCGITNYSFRVAQR
jgi:hypothetical protein